MNEELRTVSKTDPLEDFYAYLDPQTVSQAKEFEKIMLEEIEDYEATAGDFETLLGEDHELLETLADELSLLAIAEASKEDSDEYKETLEIAYLNVIDKCAQLSKTYHPLSEMGMDRLGIALSISDSYEGAYRPLMTQVTEENIDRFASFLTENLYDEIVFGHKKAIGALRYREDKAYAAGIAVYHFETGEVTVLPILRIDHIFVADPFRQQGVGNHLMARLFGFAAQYPECVVTVSYSPPEEPYEQALEEMNVIEQYLDSWKFDFSMNYGDDYFIRIEDLKDSRDLDRGLNGVVSLESLKDLGEKMLKDFFEARKDSGDESASDLPYEYFDKNASCAVVKFGAITHLLLMHRYEDEGYRVLFWGGDDEDESVLPRLIRFSCRTLRTQNDPDAVISGTFTSEECVDIIKKAFPSATSSVTYDGILMKPRLSEDMTTEQWMELMKSIGLPDILDEKSFNEDLQLTKRQTYEIRKAFEEIAGNLAAPQ
jgi:GNAT superfamily N-acetyltransferase